jgi:hypothetical protein
VSHLASAIKLDRKLEHPVLSFGVHGWTIAASVALVEAFAANTSLCTGSLFEAILGVQAYQAFSVMLHVNTSLFPTLPRFQTAVADERPVDSHNQMRIE